MTRRVFRLPFAGQPFLDLFSSGRLGPPASAGFNGAQIELIRRTVRRAPEVMVKVTGGGRTVGAVAAHLRYISRNGRLEIETDEGQRVSTEGQKALVKDWHLELSAGQYRGLQDGMKATRPIKLVHNVVLSMPAPTPPDKVLAAAKTFARDKFAAKHQYAIVLHTHQQHPHVHLVVKAEGYDGRRLHIDKAMLREWRQDFARMMREQGIAANATTRAVRGQTKGAVRDALYRTRRRGSSHVLREKVQRIARELTDTKSIRDPARTRLLETRKSVIDGWNAVAATLEAQGEIVLGGDVRYFAMNLPPVLTDRERLAEEFIRYVKARTSAWTRGDDPVRDRLTERTR